MTTPFTFQDFHHMRAEGGLGFSPRDVNWYKNKLTLKLRASSKRGLESQIKKAMNNKRFKESVQSFRVQRSPKVTKSPEWWEISSTRGFRQGKITPNHTGAIYATLKQSKH